MQKHLNISDCLFSIEDELVDVKSWCQENIQTIESRWKEQGALLLRPLEIAGSRKLASVLQLIFEEPLMDYGYRSTPRTKMRGRIYTSSEYHPSETIPLHSENAYSNSWPMKIAFYCVTAAKEGGATPIADNRRVLQSIDKSIKSEFEQRGLCYTRNYDDQNHGHIDLPWQEVFQSDSKEEVAMYCNSNNIQFEWREHNALRTKQKCQAIHSHPRTGERIWFNQAHLFHISNLQAEARENLLKVYSLESLPRNVSFADGGAIPDEYLHHIREVYRRCELSFPWQEGDLLILDNMLFCHGRHPYKGDRSVLVGMAGSHSAALGDAKNAAKANENIAMEL